MNIGPQYPAPIASARRAFFSATAPSHNAVGTPFVNAILPPRRKSSACDCGLLYFNQMVATKDWKERSSISYKRSVLAVEFLLRIAGIFYQCLREIGGFFRTRPCRHVIVLVLSALDFKQTPAILSFKTKPNKCSNKRVSEAQFIILCLDKQMYLSPNDKRLLPPNVNTSEVTITVSPSFQLSEWVCVTLTKRNAAYALLHDGFFVMRS